MARDRGPPVLRQHAAAAAALPAEARGWGWLAAGLWPALVVGLLAALVAWLWYGSGDGRSDESGEATAGTAPLRGGEERRPQDGAEAAAAAATGTGRRGGVRGGGEGDDAPGGGVCSAPACQRGGGFAAGKLNCVA